MDRPEGRQSLFSSLCADVWPNRRSALTSVALSDVYLSSTTFAVPDVVRAAEADWLVAHCLVVKEPGSLLPPTRDGARGRST